MIRVISVFPGLDGLGKGFELEGFFVVRGPDKILAGDIADFHVPSGMFDGVIGGPPCQEFSGANRTPQLENGMAMLSQFQRIVEEAKPTWWLMENVARVPDLVIPGYSWQRIPLRANEFGLSQSRLRHIQFGHRDNMVLNVPRGITVPAVDPCCMATEGKKTNRRDWERFCNNQGFDILNLDSFSIAGRYRLVGNAVPLPMARALALGIKNLLSPNIKTCACTCGRPVSEIATAFNATCRKTLQLRRDRDRRELTGM